MSSEMALPHPVAFITGSAGKGIGTACALLFARKGYNIVITDVVDTSSVKADVEKLGAKCLAIHLDVRYKESVDAGVAEALSVFGKIDCLVNNAAKSLGTDILQLDDATWDANVTLALKSVYLLCKAVLPGMLERSSGCIVNVASVNGQTGIGEEAYAAAKAGVINLTQNLAVRYGPKGIRVNAVSPGTIETPLWTDRLANNPKTLDNLKKYYPLGRLGKPDDVANAVHFLASEGAAWITGVTLNVDGGLMAGNSGLVKDLMGD